jgi:hypothetical protein
VGKKLRKCANEKCRQPIPTSRGQLAKYCSDLCKHRADSRAYRAAHREEKRAYHYAYEAGRRAERQRFLNAHKREHGCAICGRKDGGLDFHHIDPKTKTAPVASLSRYSMTKILAELKKCRVLCNGCHRDIHKAARTGAVIGVLQLDERTGKAQPDTLLVGEDGTDKIDVPWAAVRRAN